ncbi:hypothetical protein [Undibacterium sp.]|jgi:hypothetical protein|uniref:hypothetical protein n=1 Tax=Undibacterium sp. TaxID=1914977 RepID=UPI002CCF1A27|nr:hypothetical protein [Undibacterium sp.]HTD06549.1 hypothetical protein [Undibacterium sp.]
MRDIKDSKTLELPGLEPEHYAASEHKRTMLHRSKNTMEAQEQLELLEPTDNSGLPLWTWDENTDLTGLPVWAKE